MQRKIIKLGTATLVASLPSRWIKANGLKQGDLLSVDEQGSDLRFSTRKELGPKTARFKIAKAEDFMSRLIHTPYRFGYDRLEISFDDVQVMHLIRKSLDALLGFEVTEQGERHCVVEMVAKGMEDEFDKILKRAVLVIIGMFQDLAKAVQEEDKALLDDVIEREHMTNKLTHFCMRVLNSRVGEPSRTNYLSIVASSLEIIGDDLRDLARFSKGAKLKKQERDALTACVRSVQKAFEEFSIFLQKPSKESAFKIRNLLRQGRKVPLLEPGSAQSHWTSIPSGAAGPLWSLLVTVDHMVVDI